MHAANHTCTFDLWVHTLPACFYGKSTLEKKKAGILEILQRFSGDVKTLLNMSLVGGCWIYIYFFFTVKNVF